MLESVQYLMRDDDGAEEGSSDRRVYDEYVQGMMEDDGVKKDNLKELLPSTTDTATEDRKGGDIAEDYDHID